MANKVLIVDDKLENLYLLEMILKGNGYLVIQAINGVEALIIARKEIPDLIISDILMPVMDGFNLCREIKKDKRLCAIPFIFYTATYTDPKDEEFALSLGADRFLLKPQDPDDLFAIVETVMKESEGKNIQSNEETQKAEIVVLKEYNEALVRKLEDKMLQTEKSERELRENNILLRKEIKERIHAEEDLRNSEIRYRRLFEAAKDGILILDAKSGRIIDINPFLTELFGNTKGYFIDKEIWEINFFKEMISNKEDFSKLQNKEYIRFEDLPLRTFDGRKISVELISNVYVVGSQVVLHCNIRDITKRKLAEYDLRKSEKKFRQFVETAMEGICSLDKNENIIFANFRLAEMFGYKPEEILSKKFDDFMFPEDLHDHRLKMGKRKQGESDIYERRFKRKDGIAIWTLISATPVMDENGDFGGSFGMFTDITDRKAAEEILRESEERFRSVAQSANDAIITSDREGIISGWNGGAERIFGYSEKEIFGKSITILIPQESIGKYLESMNTILTETTNTIIGKTIEIPGRHKNGTEFSTELSLSQWETASGIYFTGIIRDITSRKKSEKDMRMLAHSVESVAECVSITDADDKIIFVNNAFLKIYGYTKEELLDQHISVVRPKGAEEIEKFKDILPKTIQGGWKGEVINRKKDGTIFPVYLSTSVVIDDQGAPIALIGVATDITEQKKDREELIQAKEKAEQASELKTEFLAQMSHEIRTPINVIMGNIDYLKDYLSKEHDPEIAGCFDGIDQASKRIIRTIDLILNVSELQTSGYKSVMTELDLNSEILVKLYHEYEFSAHQKGLGFFYYCNGSEFKILADEYSMTQIFANLIDNAIKYTKKGKIEITLEKNSEGDFIAEIKDTGIGMKKEFLANMFEPFVQEDKGMTRSFEGNGLGLALVKEYCKINNVSIEVESTKNVGSDFKVIFKKQLQGTA